jgi:hypothetical protein
MKRDVVARGRDRTEEAGIEQPSGRAAACIAARSMFKVMLKE